MGTSHVLSQDVYKSLAMFYSKQLILVCVTSHDIHILRLFQPKLR